MAKITNFIYCLNAEKVTTNGDGGETINANGIMAALTPEFVPGTFSFSILFSVLDADITVNNNIRIAFGKKDVDKKLVDSGIIHLPPMPDKDEVGLPKEYKGLNMSMDLRNVIFESEGLYCTEIIFNGEILGEYPVYVKGKRCL